jgi:hypothetical protein
VIAGLLYKKTLACALLLLIFSIGFRHPSLAKTSIDCDRIRLYIGRGRLSVGDSAIRNHSGSGDHARQNCSSDDERIKAYATITIDDCFVIQGLRLFTAETGLFSFYARAKNG